MRAARRRKTSVLGRASPGAGKSGAGELQIVVAVGEVEVGVFEESGGGQNDIGEIGGIGLELFEHDGEQIVAAQAAAHRVLIGRDGGGVGIVDHQGFHGRVVDCGQRVAELRHVDDAGFAAERRRELQVGAFQSRRD